MAEYKSILLILLLLLPSLNGMKKDLKTIYYIDSYLVKLEKSQIAVSFIEALLFNTLIFDNNALHFKDFKDSRINYSISMEQATDYLENLTRKMLTQESCIDTHDGIFFYSYYSHEKFNLSPEEITSLENYTVRDLHCLAIKRLLVHYKFYDFLKGTSQQKSECKKTYKALFNALQAKEKNFSNFKHFLKTAEQSCNNLKKLINLFLSKNYLEAKSMSNCSFMLVSEPIIQWLSQRQDFIKRINNQADAMTTTRKTMLPAVISKSYGFLLYKVLHLVDQKDSRPINAQDKLSQSSCTAIIGQ